MLKDSDNESEDEKGMEDITQTNNTMHMNAKMDSMCIGRENALICPVKQSNKKIKGVDTVISNVSSERKDKESDLSPKKVQAKNLNALKRKNLYRDKIDSGSKNDMDD